ncbi:MAG TPA: hypothetical protein VJG49_02025 [Candidatus Nanoarchaeia archaeon]|nr:hypothetical protein [Candidatus Nanoarchaeia archaeon]
MRVVHYQREQSTIHVHARLRASYFFIPDRQVVLFAEKQGNFSGTSYSISEREDILREAQALSEGKVPEINNVEYSNIKAFDYDDTRLRSLIEQAKQGKDLEEKVIAGIKDLMKEVKEKEEPVLVIDPASLDTATKARLEQLVETNVKDNGFKSALGVLFGHKRAEEVREEQTEQYLRECLRKYQERKMSFSSGTMGRNMSAAQQAGLEEVARGFAQIAYKAEERSAVSYEERIQAAGILGEDALPLKKKRLLRVMTVYLTENADYLTAVRQASDGILEADVQEIAREAYNTMMQSRWGNGYQDTSDHLHATQLAKAYLGEGEFHDAGRKAVEASSEEISHNQWEKSGKAIAELGLPDVMVRPLMLRIFEATLSFRPEQATEIEQLYEFTDDEMRPLVDRVHMKLIDVGDFERVLPLHERYGSLIQDQTISTEDVRTLVGLMKYRPEAEKETLK